MEKYTVREHFCKYGGAAFFDGARKLIAIYVCDLPDLESETVKPSSVLVMPDEHHPDDPKRWEFAKFSLRSTLVSLCTLRDHLCYCHWIVSNRVSIASRQEVSYHPNSLLQVVSRTRV